MYKIVKKGRVYCSSPVKNCGYTDEQLESLRQNGYSLMKDNVIVMKGRKTK